MKIRATAREILNAPALGSWDDFCERNAINPWAINEGRMDGDEEFDLTKEQAQGYGLIPRDAP